MDNHVRVFTTQVCLFASLFGGGCCRFWRQMLPVWGQMLPFMDAVAAVYGGSGTVVGGRGAVWGSSVVLFWDVTCASAPPRCPLRLPPFMEAAVPTDAAVYGGSGTINAFMLASALCLWGVYAAASYSGTASRDADNRFHLC